MSSPAAHQPARGPADPPGAVREHERRGGQAQRGDDVRAGAGRASRSTRNEPAYTNGRDRRLAVDDVAVQRAAALDDHAHRSRSRPRRSRTAGARTRAGATTSAPTTIATPSTEPRSVVASGWRRRPAVSSAVIVPRARIRLVRTRRSTPLGSPSSAGSSPCVGIGLTVLLPRAAGRGRQPRRPGVARGGAWGSPGSALTLLALGSPWSARTAADDRRRRRSRTSRPSAASTSMNGAASTRKRLFSR